MQLTIKRFSYQRNWRQNWKCMGSAGLKVESEETPFQLLNRQSENRHIPKLNPYLYPRGSI